MFSIIAIIIKYDYDDILHVIIVLIVIVYYNPFSVFSAYAYLPLFPCSFIPFFVILLSSFTFFPSCTFYSLLSFSLLSSLLYVPCLAYHPFYLFLLLFFPFLTFLSFPLSCFFDFPSSFLFFFPFYLLSLDSVFLFTSLLYFSSLSYPSSRYRNFLHS